MTALKSDRMNWIGDVTTNYERRLERLEENLDRREPLDSRTSAEVRAFIQEMFYPTPEQQARQDAEDKRKETDPDAYPHETWETMSRKPERVRYISECFGVKVWNGKRWELTPWDEWLKAQGRSTEGARDKPWHTPLP